LGHPSSSIRQCARKAHQASCAAWQVFRGQRSPTG
jgi:hypothetical protein